MYKSLCVLALLALIFLALSSTGDAAGRTWSTSPPQPTLIASTGCCGSSPETTVEKQPVAPTPGDPVSVRLEPLPLRDLGSFVRKHGLSPLEICYAEPVGDDIFSGGYTPSPSETIEQSAAAMLREHIALLRGLILSNDRMLKRDAQAVGLALLNRQLRQLKVRAQSHSFAITRLVLPYDERIAQLTQRGVFLERPSPLATAPKSSPDNNIRLVSTSHESWAPYGGTADVTSTYASHTFYFNNTSAFKSNSTYEHETQVYNSKFANAGSSWSSNLPRAYKDTQFADSIDNFTIGSAQASSIKKNYRYYTQMSLKPETARTATVRIKGQLGERRPSGCYSTWCVWPVATTGTMALLQAPVGLSWQY